MLWYWIGDTLNLRRYIQDDIPMSYPIQYESLEQYTSIYIGTNSTSVTYPFLMINRALGSFHADPRKQNLIPKL